MFVHVELLSSDLAKRKGSNRSSSTGNRLRQIFTCCHPALSPYARVALTLRIVRAKAKIREAKIPYKVPLQDEMPRRKNCWEES